MRPLRIKNGIASPITIDGRTVLATKMTAGIVKRVLRERQVRVVDVEQYLYGERGDHMSPRLIRHRHDNTVKAISRARKFLTDTYGDEGWLEVRRTRDGFAIALRSTAAAGPLDRVGHA